MKDTQIEQTAPGKGLKGYDIKYEGKAIQEDSSKPGKMEAEVYVKGKKNGDKVATTLSSSSILFLVQYCSPLNVRFTFVEDADDSNKEVHFPLEALEKFQYTFSRTELLPLVIQNCQLPVVSDPKMTMVRSGLCGVVRHIVKLADSTGPSENFKDLLGFRQGSLRMCAEVSGWTKLCEVELNDSLTQLIHKLRSTCTKEDIELPQDLIKLEEHFKKPPRIHNDDKLRRAVLKEVKENLNDDEKRIQLTNQCTSHEDGFTLLREKYYPHGNRKFKISKTEKTSKCESSKEQTVNSNLGDTKSSVRENNVLAKGDNCQSKGDHSIEALIQGIEKLTYLDVSMEHLYSEGFEMTVADLILFVYMYHVLEVLDFVPCGLWEKVPLVMNWLQHMVQVKRIENMSAGSCFNVGRLRQGLLQRDAPTINFTLPDMEEVTDDDMELTRRCKSKHKAYKPDVSAALKKINSNSIHPETGEHLRGRKVQVDWDALPVHVHPKEGHVPAKRTARKCQQLENLVTAVQSLAKPGDVIVDFCSGGGHLGIAIAYLLPSCKVFLIENKEESLMKAKHRIDVLGIDNVVLYQCNLDYFHGKFDIGVCLHACGSATDMVLQQCLNNNSAFVICPCCYGSIQKTHLLSYPRSKMFQAADISYKDFLTLGHAADQTEFNIALEEQGRHCSNLVDTDRAELAREKGYSVILCSLQPRTCTPKNNLLIGSLQGFENCVS